MVKMDRLMYHNLKLIHQCYSRCYFNGKVIDIYLYNSKIKLLINI